MSMSLLEVNQQSELFLTLNLAAPGSFEPGIDYVVTNPAMAGRALPSRCWRTATIPQADPTLTTQMKSVGEAMAIGRTFKESRQKCLRPLETR